MTPAPGTNLGPYRIEAPIGAGGMGAVYKARDTRLDRTVAIKIVEGRFSERFEREAKTIASLNHPHICTLHDVGENYLVMEYIEGVPVSGPLPLQEVLRLGAQIADALDAAHRKGITHRDLKPGNVLISKAGAKVIDFGLAKAGPVVRGEFDVTMTKPLTGEGAILGTICYMSPEQLQGQEADARSDIFALGCVLYEMLTGKRAFDGKSPVSIMAAILEHEPAPLSEAQPMTPAWLDRVIRRCLRKNPDDRWQSARDVAIELREPPVTTPPPASASKAVQPSRFRFQLTVITSIIAALGITCVMVWAFTRPPAGKPTRRFQLKPALGDKSAPRDPAISPDGSMVAYVDGGRLWIHDLDKLEPREMPRTDGAQFTIWSPDSGWLAFVAKGSLWKISSRGSEPIMLASLAGVSMNYSNIAGGGGWGEDGRIVLATGSSSLLAVPSDGGEVATLLQADRKTEMDFHSASVLPAKEGVLFISHSREDRTLTVFSRGIRKALRSRAGNAYAVYSPTGHIVSVQSGGLWAAPFSLTKMEVSGEPFPVVRGGNQPTVSRDGTLVFRWGSPSGRLLTQVDRDGNVMEAMKDPPSGTNASLSRDGRRILYTTGAGSVRAEAWIYDIGSRSRTRVANGTGARWVQSGDRIVYSVQAGGSSVIHLKSADSSSETQRIGEGRLTSVSDDGKYFFFAREGALWYQTLDARSEPISIGKTGQRPSAVLSPDSRYLLYTVDESGRNEVYVARFPAMDRKWRISVNGGAAPKWNRRGDRIYFLRDGTLCEVDFSSTDVPSIRAPRDLFTGDALDAMLEEFGYDPTPDGNSFLITRQTEEKDSGTGIVVVENWFQEFKKREPK